MGLAVFEAMRAFARTRRLARQLRSREDVLRWQGRQLDRYLRRTLPAIPFYAALAPRRLTDLPVLDKAALLSEFERFNTRGVTLAAARAALDRGQDRVRGLVVGQSTGTSGNRGVFVISHAERFTWLGVILAKTLPDVLWRRHKVALALPAYSQLYDSARQSGRLAIRFFDLGLGVEAWQEEMRRFGPDTIVAPPKVLRALAEAGGLAPANVFSGAEVLDPLDRAVIEAGFGVRVREIYMATEGLFGVACPHGVLHLAEDVVAFEWEAAPGSADLVAPIVTDFTRRTQAMARYRMNDLLRLSPTRCACGSPLQAVLGVEGRQDDVFKLTAAAGGRVMVTPDVVRNAIIDADRRIQDFRAVQTGPEEVLLSLAADLPLEAGEAAIAKLQAALGRAGAGEVRITLRSGLDVPFDRKLRRVRRDWSPPDQSISVSERS
jgi:putative adenylate-forming enzyme